MPRMDEVELRRAGPGDAGELTRLRALMFEELGRHPALFDAA